MATTQGRLTKSSADRKIGGVAAGMAHHFNVDVTLVRVLWVIFALGTGFGVIAYLVLYIVLPWDYTVTTTPNAVTIAEERFARGEITKEELDQIRRDLG
ncbi:MAG TPA: PspC domain-containing protein [Actinomycetota bacterium]|nr:PspC domain-containing protein [Actinomycetota bacterium]